MREQRIPQNDRERDLYELALKCSGAVQAQSTIEKMKQFRVATTDLNLPTVPQGGANAAAIHKGEDRLAFKEAMIKIGLDMPQSGVAHTLEEGRKIAAEIALLGLIIIGAFKFGADSMKAAFRYSQESIIEICDQRYVQK